MKYSTKITLSKSAVEESITRPTLTVVGNELSSNPADYSPAEFAALVRIAGAQLKIGPIQAYILADIQEGREKPIKDAELAAAFAVYSKEVDMKAVLMGKLEPRGQAGLAALKARLWAAIDADDMALAKSIKAEIAELEAVKKATKSKEPQTAEEIKAEIQRLVAETEA